MAYLTTKQLEPRRLWDTILWRFYTSFFYSLALLLGDGRVNLTDGLYGRLLEAISQSSNVTDKIDVIQAKLQLWTTAGARYYKICQYLGDGALFLLPHISDSV